jgi:hypothetical protein
MRKSVRVLLSTVWGCALLPIGVAIGNPAWAQGSQGTPQGSSPGSQGSQGSQGTPGSAQTPPPAAVQEELVSIPVTVEDIDKKSRTMTVKTADGDRIPLSVPADVQGFDKLKKGDKIDIDYYRAVAVRVLPSGATASDSPPAAGGRGPQMTSSSQVVGVNRRDNSLKVKDQSGKSQSMSVQDPAMQRQVQNLKPGQAVEITYTEAVLAGIHPHNK